MSWQGAAKEFISFISRGKLLILGMDSKLILAAPRGTLDGSLLFPEVVGNHLHNRSRHLAGENRQDNQRHQ
jgi:hypothetical protein